MYVTCIYNLCVRASMVLLHRLILRLETNKC